MSEYPTKLDLGEELYCWIESLHVNSSLGFIVLYKGSKENEYHVDMHHKLFPGKEESYLELDELKSTNPHQVNYANESELFTTSENALKYTLTKYSISSFITYEQLELIYQKAISNV